METIIYIMTSHEPCCHENYYLYYDVTNLVVMEIIIYIMTSHKPCSYGNGPSSSASSLLSRWSDWGISRSWEGLLSAGSRRLPWLRSDPLPPSRSPPLFYLLTIFFNTDLLFYYINCNFNNFMFSGFNNVIFVTLFLLL